MKKIYLILSFIGLTVTAFGQGYTATSFGYLGGQSSAVLSERDSVKINISGGSVVATNQFYTLQLDRAQAMTGFPPMVSYFPDVFSQEVFISKGYFADYVQLKWTIKSQQDRISRIKVYRKPLGFNGDSLLIATLADDDFSYRDEYAEKGVLYKYTVFAEGIADDLRLPFINIVEGVGFAFPFGTVAGSVAYEGGTAVAGVQILAETDGSLGGKSISLNGTDAYLSLDHGTNDDELDLEKGFTLQLWAQYQGSTRGTIFSKGGQYELAYEPGNLSFTVGDVTLDMPYNHPVDSFFHVSAVYDPLQGLKLYVQESDYVMDSAIAAIPTPPAKARDVIYFGRSSAEDNYYGGIIDEIRLWNKALSYEEVHSNFSRYLSGSEANLSGYWKLNSGNGNGFYDFSREGFEFHENHGVIWRGAWSGTVPDKSQLAYRGVTDAKGNFVVRGFPYETAGSQYTFTPIFGVHEFEPAQQLRFVGDGAAIFNGVNFKDVSSFPVSGTIKYRHSSFPVEGISLLIDGNAAIDQEGLLITSDNLGQFTIDVPIGFHSIRLSKNGHVFEEEGRFPPRTVPDKIPTYDFQQPLAGLEFIDNSLVKFVGKVVGGPVEAEKPRGFGLSKSNIGIAQITITTEKGYDISTSDSTVVYNDLPDYAERDIDNYSEFKNKFVNVFPDPETGEFVTYLLPEKHVITGVTAGDYVFGDEHKVTVNLETSFEQTDTYDELVMELRADGTPLPGYISIDSSKYDYFTSEEILDTTYVYGGKNFSYEKDKDFILRVKPGIEVVNADGLELFGESLYTYEDELRTDEITLIDGSNNYTFGHPVFSQQRRYNMFISVFEEYTNGNTGASDRVPVKDGKVEIVNDFGINRDAETLTLDDKGKARYLFAAGFPELNKNFVDGNLSFTRPFALTAVTGETGNIRTTWHEADPLRGIVFGGVPQGNNFVTTGPNQIITVLRDPPGSNSRAYLEKGKTMTQTVTWESSLSGEVSANLKLSLGYKNETWAGVGAGVINEVEATADLDLGIKVESEFKENGESVNTITTTKTWSTSEDPSFVSAPGDVFVGNSTNIVYGTAVSIQPIPVTDEECVTGDCDGIVNGDFQLGPRRGLRMNPEFGTMFIYTQSHIEKVLIPNLIEIRNSMLAYSPNPASVTATTDVIYLSLVAPDDERYGSANYNMAHWGDAATIDVGVGPSYKILIPSVVDSATVSDTIAYFNKQIEGWIRTLENNEKAKVNASLSENISFDGGTSYSSSETVESTNSYAFDFSVGVTASMATSVGIAVNGIGAEVSMSMSAKMGRSDGGGTSVSNLTTYAYELADQNSTGINAGSTGDYYSIDVKTPSDGFGPVFVTRAGVSSCPYEGESKTKYFEPDQHVLNFATIQAEKPELTIINPLVANVPSNREAVLNLELKNNSENGADVYYVLSVEDQTNFNGAILSIDGAVLTGDGRVFYVPAGQAVSKILKVAKGSDDINDYENIDLKISSQCDANIYDIQPFSVYFQPGCSDVNLVSPVDLWVINTNTTPEETQNIIFNDYDLQNSQFRYAKFQYKASSSSQWLTNMIFYNPMLVNQTEYDGLDEPKAWLSETGATSYPWDMSDLPDRKFDVRVVSVCELAPGVTAETPTDTHTGVKDVKRPVAFGAPQPADGVLSANDEIMIQFDETIEAGLLTPFNFSVRGVLNSAEIRHSTSINFDGVNDYVKIGDGLNLTDRSFTVEFWIKREDFAKEQVVYSKGFSSSDVFELGFTADNKFFVNAGGQRATSVNTYTDLAWNHFAVVYSQSSGLADVYMNDQYVMSQAAINTAFTGEGSIVIGKSQITNDRHFVGNLHELRIWTKTRQLGDIYAKMSKTLTGSEVGLVGYWPMDEAIGIRAFDKARFRHAILFADWEVSPKGNAFAFDGVNDHVELNTASTVIVTSEMDFTIEFWFNGSPNQTNAIMFSSGKGDGTDIFNDPANSLSIGFDDAGLLYFINDGEILTVSSGNYLDDNWHHFAFTLLRQSNANILVDGVQKATRASSNFGGLSGASMWIGARGFKVNAVDKSFDHYFSGAIDEFRVWNLGMKSDQINLNINSRLIGDEIGLVGYYPFEYYETVTGVKIMNSTLEDQWINPYGENGGVATSFGGADFSDDTPNIKDARPVDKVDFDWAVNGDKIIITPAESFKALIEQTILEITVQNIEDLFENRLASPITWTAFVDRNQLKWDTDQIEARKEIYAPYSFTTDIVNFGGTETSFSIDNLPLWLSASPSSGVLSPVSSKTIKFTVNDGLNTGNYLEDVFLSSNFGYDEKLTIDLQVYSPEPDWDTNPFDFQFSMNLVAQLEIANILSSDVNDRVAAFVNNEIRGDVNLIYVEGLDLYEVFLDVYSNVESGETIELRVWDSDKGVEYRNALPQITFESNTIIGSPGNPDKIIAGDVSVQKISFNTGWNWSSVNINASSLGDVNAFMSGITAASGDQIKGIDKVDVYSEGIGWLGTLSSSGGLKNGPMYLFKLSNPGSVEVIGTQADAETSVTINSGWNWLGFIPRFNMNINEAFAFFNPASGDIIKSQFAFSVYDQNLGWIGSLRNMEPGKGYLFQSANSGFFKYPEASFLSSGRNMIDDNLISDFIEIDRFKYPYTMSVIAEFAEEVSTDLILTAYSGEELRGVMEPVNTDDGSVLYFMTVYGNMPEMGLTLKAFNSLSGEEFVLDQTITFEANNLSGKLSSPLQLTGLDKVNGVSGNLNYVMVYPNPFDENLEVYIPAMTDEIPRIVLTDIVGREMGQLNVLRSGNGWQASINEAVIQLSSGVYLINIYSGNEIKSVRVIKN